MIPIRFSLVGQQQSLHCHEKVLQKHQMYTLGRHRNAYVERGLDRFDFACHERLGEIHLGIP